MFKQITWYSVSFTYPIKITNTMKKFNAFLALVLLLRSHVRTNDLDN